MANKINYWVTHEKDLKYTLLFVGLFLIAWGGFFDLTWFRSLAECYSMDGECQRSAVLNFKAIFLTSSGFFIVLSMLGGYPGALFKRQRVEVVLDLTVLLILLLFLISSQVRYFNNDEYEHLHNAWLMTEGTIPYFEWSIKHTPLLEWVAILFMGITGEHAIIVQTMRFFIFLTTCGSLWLVYLIVGKLFGSRLHAMVAVALILSNQIWFTKSPEIRPDNLMVFLVLASFWFLIKYHEHPQAKHLVAFGGLALLAMLAKQNAAIFCFPVGVIFFYHRYISNGKKKFKPALIALGMLLVFFSIPPFREFMFVNIHRHLIPNDIRFAPWAYLRKALSFNPAIFILFLLQIFSPMALAEKYHQIKPYLYAISITALFFLFIMNRPFQQEMLIMVIFMGMVSANMLVEIMGRLDGKLKYLISMVLLAPVVYYMALDGLARTWTKDLNTTKAILRISKRDDLVFDSYGKPIFRHHPLEPQYLVYLPQKFSRLEELKKSGVKYMIMDFYTGGLPANTIDWLKRNFVSSDEDPKIGIRKNQSNAP